MNRSRKNVTICAKESIQNHRYSGITWDDIFNLKGPIPTFQYTLKVDNAENSTNYFWSNTVLPDVSVSDPKGTSVPMAPYMDNEEGLISCADIEDHFDVKITKSGKFLTNFYVPSVFLSAIIGTKGSKLRELQEKTQTVIKVPRKDQTGDIKITGNTERSVVSARSQILMIVLTKREKLSSTHFVSIPVQSAIIKENFNKFKDEILSGTPTRGIDESIFQNPDKLHITVVMLTLVDESEIVNAKEILNSHVENFLPSLLQNKDFAIKLEGVEIMNDDPSEVDVLYGKVNFLYEDDKYNFQQMVDSLAELFYKNDLVRRQYDKVKLHVTLMNSIFRKGDNSKRTTFDASDILERYKYFDFGTGKFDRIDLSIRFTTGKDGYYDCLFSKEIR